MEFHKQLYATCSAAAEAARESVTGRHLNTNGWTFWQYQGAGGKTLTLHDARKQFLPPQPPSGEDSDPERHRLRRKFWKGLLARASAKTTLHANIAPGKFEWLGVSSGIRGLGFNYVIRQREGRAELYIDRGDAATNKGIFDKLHALKAEIEKAFGSGLSWQRLDDKQGCRIAHMMTVGGWKSDEKLWPNIQDEMIDAMVRLEKAVSPFLATLKAELG